MKKGNSRLILFFAFMLISVSLVACEEGVQENLIDKPKDEEIKVAATTKINNYNNLSQEEIINLVESINPYELKPTMAAEERYELRSEIYRSLTNEETYKLSRTIIELSSLLTGTVSDDLYKNLFDENEPKWAALELTMCYYAHEKIENIKHLVSYQPLLDDFNTVVKLCEEGVDQRNILKIVDAKRILQDISRHLIQAPYTGPGEEVVDYGDLHELYFKASKTLEENHNMISDLTTVVNKGKHKKEG